ENRLGFPDEDAAVPEVPAGAYHRARPSGSRFLREQRDTVDPRSDEPLRGPDVAKAGVGVSGWNADRHESAATIGGANGPAHGGTEDRDRRDEMVGRQNDHDP